MQPQARMVPSQASISRFQPQSGKVKSASLRPSDWCMGPIRFAGSRGLAEASKTGLARVEPRRRSALRPKFCLNEQPAGDRAWKRRPTREEKHYGYNETISFIAGRIRFLCGEGSGPDRAKEQAGLSTGLRRLGAVGAHL